MPKGRWFSGVSEIWTKSTLVSSFLIANSFVWYYVILSALQNIDGLPTWIWAIHFSGLLVSAVGGASITKRMKRNHVLVSWMVLTIIATFTLFFLESSSIQIIGLAGLVLGVTFGFGMPSCMSLFSDSAPVERRGRLSGITILITGIGLLAFSSARIDEGPILVAVMAIWRLSSIAVFFLAKPSIGTRAKTQNLSYMEIVFQKSFLLYLLPWLMFSLVNYLTAPMVGTGTKIDSNLVLLQAGFTGIFGILGGFLIDMLGRKKVAIAGFVLLGIGTAILAINPTDTTSPKGIFTSYFNAAIDGVAWGFLLVLFILTLWGDLSEGSRSEKYYALGAAPFFISMLLEASVGPSLASSIGDGYGFFSFSTFFLFIAVLPLVYAPETLPEKVMKNRDLSSYVNKALQKVQKESEKTLNKESDETNSEKEESFQISTEDEEAQELAEKYY